MAQNFMEILTKQEDFFPTDPPHGMKDFQFDELTKKQREHLNNFKMKTIRENHRYLKEHPEIKTVVKLLFHAVLKERPNIKVCDFFAKYVIKNYGLLSTILVQRASEPTASIKTVIIDDSKENIISKSDTKQTSSQVTIKQVETVVYRRHLSSAGAQKWLEAQETKIVAEEILSEILNVICKDDVISQFQTYFAGSKRV